MCAPHGSSMVRKIVPSFVARALSGMPIEVNGSGNQRIDLVYVDDVSEVIVDGLAGGLLEAGTGVASKVIDVANLIVAHTDSRSRVVHVPMRDGEPEEAVVVAQQPRCRHAWPYRLDETIDWYRAVLANAHNGG